MAESGLHFSAWHPLLVRTLRTFLDDRRLTGGVRLGSLLAILTKLPIPQESQAAIDAVLPTFRAYLLSLSLTDALTCSSDVSPYFCDDFTGFDKHSSSNAKLKQKRRPSLRCWRRRLISSSIPIPDSDSERPPYRRPKTLHIHERVLLSDSDGFAAFAGDVPPAGDEWFRSEIDDNSLFSIYRSVFGAFPTLVTTIDCLINGLVVFARFSMKCGVPIGISTLCTFFEKSTNAVSMRQDSQASSDHFVQWFCWQAILRNASRSLAQLANMAKDVLGYDFDRAQGEVVGILLDCFGKNVCASIRLNSFLGSGEEFDEMHLAAVDDAMRATHDVTGRLFEDLLSLMAVCRDKSNFPRIGDYIVSWAEDPQLVQYIPKITCTIERTLGIFKTGTEEHVRFAFELFASLVDINGLSIPMLNWCLLLPSGLRKSVTGVELLAAISGQVVVHSEKCCQILKRHLPVITWSSSVSGSTENLPSEAVIRFCENVLTQVPQSTLLRICSILLPYCDSVDKEFLLINAVIPSIETNCKNNHLDRETDSILVTPEMSTEMKEILKGLEILAAYLKTEEASADVIRKIACPYRDFYFSASELQDVFVAVCSKAVHYSPTIALNAGLCEWMVDRLSCFRQACADIWLFVEDSAAKFSKLLISMLNLIGDIIENGPEPFSTLLDKLRTATVALIDVCFEWLSNPSVSYRSVVRISEIVSKALSIHLLVSTDTNDVIARFSAALLRSLGQNPPEILVSVLTCSLLDRCISVMPVDQLGGLPNVENSSENDVLMGEGGHPGSSPTRRVIHPQLVPAVLIVITSLFKNRASIGDELEFMVVKITNRLHLIDLYSKEGARWIPQLLPLCFEMLRSDANPSTVDVVLRLVTSFIKRQPRSKDILELIRYYHRHNQYKEIVLSSLNSLLNGDPVEPPAAMIFPQRLLNKPVEITTADEAVEITRKMYNEEMELTAECSRFHAVDKFLSTNRSDGETENEQRKERKKHLRDEVRGQSMIGINQTATTKPKSAVATESAAFFPLSDLNWIAATDGLTLSFWMKRKLRSKVAHYLPLHVVSISGKELSCSCWLNGNGRLSIELTSAGIKFSKIRLNGALREDRWTHVTFGFRFTLEAITIQSSVGDCFTSKDIPSVVKVKTPRFVLTVSFGAIQKRQHHQYYLATIFGFKGLLPSSGVLVLRALGCSLTSLCETSVDNLIPNVATISTAKLVATKQHTVEAIRQDPTKYVQKVQRAVIFVIRANAAFAFGVSVLPPDIEPAYLIGQSALGMARLKFYRINWKTRLAQEICDSPNEKLVPIGGIRLLLYIYAKSVNDGLPASIQQRSLDLLLSSVLRSAVYYAEASRLNLNTVLARTLSSPLAVVDEAVMNSILRFCIDCSEVDLDFSSTEAIPAWPQLDMFHAVIREPDLLVAVTCRSDIWSGDRFPIWRRIIRCINNLMDPVICQGPHRFNRNQMVNVDMLPKLLHCLYEILQDPQRFPDFEEDEQFVADVRSIIQHLLGCPEDPSSVSQLWHFIFLSHPPNHTYIDHRVQGYNCWIQPDFFRDDPEGEILGDSQLCCRLKKYINLLGKDFLASSWKDGMTPYEMRRRYDEIAAQSDCELESADSVVRSTSSEDSVLEGPVPTGGGRLQETELHWVISLRAALMDLLAVVFQNGADSLISCLLHDVVSWHAIVILMSQQSNANIRDAVADMLQKFLLRCPLFTKIAFLRLQGFKILATQLRAHPPTAAIADFLFSMMCGETIRLGDGLDQNHLISMKVDSLSCESLHAIFVAFEGSVSDAPIFWNITNALLKTFENNSLLQQAMVDLGLVDVMVAVLRKIAYLPQNEELEVLMDRQYTSLQLECWTSFAQRIFISSIPYSDPVLGAACERFIWLLQLADIQAGKDLRFEEGKRLRGHKIIRSQLCELLHCWLQSIHTVFSEEGRSASATSSMDSLYRDGSSSGSSSPSSEPDFDYCDDAITPEKATLLDGTSPVAAFFTGSFANLRERIANMGPISRHSLKCKYKKKKGPAPLASVDTLTERMLFALDSNAAVFCVLMPSLEPPEQEMNLFHYFLYFMLRSWKKDKETSRSSGQTVWNRLVALCRDRVRVLLAQLVAFVLFPAHRKLYQAAVASRTNVVLYPNWKSDWVEEKRRQIVRALSHELQYRQSLSSLLNVNLDYEYALCLGLYDLAFIAEMKADFEEELSRMMRFLYSVKMGSSLEQFTAETLSNLTTDEILSLHSYSQHRKTVMAQFRSKMEAFLEEERKLTAEIGEVAMEVTREVVEQSNLPRKIFMKATKKGIGEFIDAENVLHLISREVCHPEAAAFEKRHWPVGWALDPTEGPMRERRRLMPYNYPFEARFFKEERRDEVVGGDEPPLQNIMGTPFNMRLVQESGQIDERITLFLDATVLRGTFECQGELHIGEKRLQFVGERAQSTQKGTVCSVITLSWSFDQLTEIQMRNYLLKSVALEVFLTNGETYLIVFHSTEKREQFVKQLSDAGLSSIFMSAEQGIQSMVYNWRHGIISNFEYLMLLNKFSGRSFNDLMQYPVFPFVLSDYTSAVLDLTNPNSFRNLMKPMAIQDKRMEAHYIKNYNTIQSECGHMDGGPQHFGPYHYGSHYSNNGIVVHYLVRLSPFTQIALEYQDHNFDIPDRLFNSIEATWRLSSSESTTDFKELIPEFFCLHEFLTNRDNLEMGTRQAGERVGPVKLPTWTPEGNPRLFVLIHRQALESHTVTSHLHFWIDLIFGFKQTGKAALEAVNVFHPATYPGNLDADDLADELSASAFKTMVRSYGQMPIQIMSTPHQPHLVAAKEKKEKEKEKEKERIPGPLASVVGVRWGDYVGSPEQDSSKISVTLSLRLQKNERLCCHLHSLLDGSVAGLPRHTVLLANSAPENPSDFMCKTRIQTCLGTLSWSFSDSLLRFRCIQPDLLPWTNVMDLHGLNVSNIAYSPMNHLLLVAFATGLIKVYRFVFYEKGLQSISFKADLLAHNSAVECLSVSDEYSIAVSGDADGKVVVWDINRLTFVRLLRKPSCSVTAVCISSTSSDIAVVSQPPQINGSRVELFTVNGDLVGTVETDTPVVCIAMTNQPEGCSINCMVLGMQDGHIKFVEMWCLSVVRDIWHQGSTQPVMSVVFAQQAKKLYALLANGRVLCWQSVSNLSKSAKAPQFLVINPHLMSS